MTRNVGARRGERACRHPKPLQLTYSVEWCPECGAIHELRQKYDRERETFRVFWSRWHRPAAGKAGK